MKQSDISKLENGVMQRTTGIARLAEALAAPATWLETGEGQPPPEMMDGNTAFARQEQFAPPLPVETLLLQLGVVLAGIPPPQREAAAAALAGWAREGGADHWRLMFLAACQKQQLTGT
jgi:hypothetical protein